MYAPEPGNGVGDPVQVAKDSIEFAKAKVHDIVIVDTAGRLGIDQELMRQARTSATPSAPTRSSSSSTR